jgi:hypothetical protein
MHIYIFIVFLTTQRFIHYKMLEYEEGDLNGLKYFFFNFTLLDNLTFAILPVKGAIKSC